MARVNNTRRRHIASIAYIETYSCFCLECGQKMTTENMGGPWDCTPCNREWSAANLAEVRQQMRQRTDIKWHLGPFDDEC